MKQSKQGRPPMDPAEKLQPVTTRFTASACEAIKQTAADNNVSMADLIRMAVAGNLSRYLGDVRIIDREQAEEIKAAIIKLSDETSKVLLELNRIGVNFNQQTKLKQIERKYGDNPRKLSTDRRMAMLQEIEDVKKDSTNLSKSDLDDLISRYENAARQVGDILCRILT